MPFVTKKKLNDIQVAMNSGIRAMFGLRRFGNDPIGDLRQDLKIPTILEIKKDVVTKHLGLVVINFYLMNQVVQ